MVEQPIVLVTRKDLPVSNMPEFIADAKANHDKMQFGSSGVGSGSHFSCAQLNAAIGVNPTHVPYRGSSLAMQDLIGGRIDYFCALGAAAMVPVESGNAKSIALLTNERSPLFPRPEDRRRPGHPRRQLLFLDAFFFPKGTPDAIVQKLYDATTQTLEHAHASSGSRRLASTVIAPESALAGLSQDVCRRRGRQMGGHDQVQRRDDRLTAGRRRRRAGGDDHSRPA